MPSYDPSNALKHCADNSRFTDAPQVARETDRPYIPFSSNPGYNPVKYSELEPLTDEWYRQVRMLWARSDAMTRRCRSRCTKYCEVECENNRLFAGGACSERA